jgi:hypothetical protein
MEEDTPPIVEVKLGLGDIVEKIILAVAPTLAEKAKEAGCNCAKRKEMLNNFGAKFSN